MPNYQIALTNTPFDNSYTNVLRFDTRAEQEAYFNVNTLFSNQPMVNFNVKNLFMPILTYDCKINENINELLSKNYCIVKDNTPNAVLKYYYYFITNAIQENSNRITISARMDIMQTYYIDLKFSQCFINKAHLNRFIDNGDGTVSFDGRVESALFEREDIKNVAKRMTKRNVIQLYDTSNKLGEWLASNIMGWIYLYVDFTHEFSFGNVSDLSKTIQVKPRPIVNINYQGGNIPSNIGVFTFPVCKSIRQIELRASNHTGKIVFGSSSDLVGPSWTTILELFSNLNQGYTNVFSLKFSIKPPTINYNADYTIEDGNLIIQCPNVTDVISNRLLNSNFSSTTYSVGQPTSSGGLYGPQETMALIEKDSPNRFFQFEQSTDYTFNKVDVIGSVKNSKFNPKLLSTDFKSLSISDTTEDGFEFDVQKINKKNLEIKYTEPLTPDISKIFITINNLSGVYVQDVAHNLTGFVNSNDTSLIIVTTAFQNMLANNKNFFLQNSINRGFNIGNSIANSATNIIAGGAFGGVAGAVVGATKSAINTGLDYAQNRINENLTVDNLKNAPSSIVGAKGNVIFEASYSEMGVVIEEWDILPNEKEMINDYMCLYGFTFNRLGNIKDFDNIRKYYNYIRADIQEISSDVGINISETVHDEFKRIFNKGVRFWNTDNFNYDKENYERWLEQND